MPARTRTAAPARPALPVPASGSVVVDTIVFQRPDSPAELTINGTRYTLTGQQAEDLYYALQDYINY